MNMSKRKDKKRNEAMVNMIETINAREETSRKEMDIRLNQYIILVIIALSTFGVLLFQIGKKK
uniref:Uncharacterized protein n=1 Tax=viral metagenome TaxID=1070528 RepID=A0A6C0AVI0_9ZZZZ|tara:strand:- start:1435 stop:1623 length:189 start_codon:yes stop_codon:yes gene_type:complete